MSQLRAFMVRKSDGNTLFLDGKYAEAYDVYAATLDDYNVLFEAIVDVNDAMIFLQKQNLLANKGACRGFIRMAFPLSTPISFLSTPSLQRKRRRSWVVGRRPWACATRCCPSIAAATH